jgi:outer membrane lipoprotein SlyB
MNLLAGNLRRHADELAAGALTARSVGGTVGELIGGPVGGAVGSIAGAAVDKLFDEDRD